MINKEISDIFHASTVLNREQLSFSKASVEALHQWVSDLSIMKLGDSSEALLNAMYEIAELDCTETLRFDLLQVLHPSIENVLIGLEKYFLDQGLSHSDRNEHIIELTTFMRAYFAKIYVDITHRSSLQLNQQKYAILKFAQNRSFKTARILSSYYALQQLGLLLTQQQMLYSPALSNQWQTIHNIYELAAKNNELLININQLQGTHFPVQNIQQAYAQVLLLDIFNTHQIRPNEIQALYQCSLDWAKLTQILPRESSLSRYIVDTTKDHPPIYNRKHHEDFKANVFVSTQQLLEHINDTIQNESTYISKNEKDFLSSALKFHVQNVLGTHSERQHERYEYSAQLQICFTLQTAHFYLSNAKTFDETLLINQNFGFRSEANLQTSIANHNHDTAQTQKIKQIDREVKQIYQTEVLDISINGYRIAWSGEAPKNLRTGELILVSESQQNKWKCAVVRWIKQSVNKSYEVGIEILSPDIYPCAIKVPSEVSSYNYQPCLLVQTEQEEQNRLSLVLPNLAHFKEQQALYLRFKNQEIKIYLLKSLFISQSFVQFDFELLNDEEQMIIDEFIQQQLNDLNNHDLWDTLK